MYPVVWDASLGSWVITSEANYENNEWYNYGEKRWANAITVTPSQREKYRTAKAGDVVDPVDVVGYYVWIPRFQYRAFATGPTEIEISFNLGTTRDESLITHPAFRFGGREISGFWVGKFETTGTSDQPTVLPNVTPISGESLNTYFESSRSFSTSTASRHGFNERKSDTHLMKNSEWGAVAYLSHSKYGTLKEITANGSGKTGGGNYQSNVAQSTTGNIYGVYDMSGGVGEYVMGNNLGETGESHMSELPETKYYDYYSSYSTTNYEVSLNGDAVKEVQVKKLNAQTEVDLQNRLVSTELRNFKSKKEAAIQPLVDEFYKQAKNGKPKEELKVIADNILFEIKNGPPFVYS